MFQKANELFSAILKPFWDLSNLFRAVSANLKIKPNCGPQLTYQSRISSARPWTIGESISLRWCLFHSSPYLACT